MAHYDAVARRSRAPAGRTLVRRELRIAGCRAGTGNPSGLHRCRSSGIAC
jgi:hypothetical protein